MRFLAFAALASACGASSSTPDARSGDGDAATIRIDAFGGPKFGEECTTSDDCQPNGYCVEGSNHDVCTYACDAGCPEGWNCRATDVAGAIVSLCVPQKFDFCKPCSDDLQCNGGVCVQLDGEGFCLPDCPFEGSCPTGYACKPDPSGVHTAHDYCVPDTGSCSCTADQAGQKRSCQTANAVGTCYGLETCDPTNSGWGGCTASTATTEVCDGMDNDCDQLIDDGVSGSACPKTNAYGTCQGVQVCNGTSVVCQGVEAAMETCNYADDDCDGMMDELWPTLSNVCSDGIGSCTRFGVIRCNSAGNGVECSAVKGSPMTELCNGLDDDCNTMTDEQFKTGPTALGTSCSVGVGACLRQGNYVCNGSGSGTQCSVTAGPTGTETCNLVDDDCDTKVDENFKNLSGQYDKDTSCGSCTTDCTVLYAVPNATGKCVVTTSPTCQMQCAANSFNVNGQSSDGCELVLDPGAIYVSKDDAAAVDDATCGKGPVGTGAGNYPCKSIAQGLTRATAEARSRVRVANAIYVETVTLVNGTSLLGGHRPDNWQRNVAGTSTVISGVGTIASTSHDYTVQAIGITSATTFEGFVVLGSVNAKTRGNSYAIYVAGSSANLSIINNTVYGGRGGAGTNGSQGGAGQTGTNGIGRASNPALYDAKITTGTGACDSTDVTNNRTPTNNGGTRSCGTDVVNGGNGGGTQCNPRPAYNTELSGLDGLIGQVGDPALGGGAGAGNDAGDDGVLATRLTSPPPTYTPICLVPSNPDYGKDGKAGADAGPGASGAGCSAAVGSVSGGHWVGGTAGGGGAGGNGGGGGGGGAGGGAKCSADLEYCLAVNAQNQCVEYSHPCSDGHDRLGGVGGGGGAGGCGGEGGTGATAGGGAFAVFVVGGTAPMITGNMLIRGEGGAGGVGGTGGNGGAGGVGADGGTSTVFCAGAAGRGGNGGDGGNGAGGGGGCGGGSFGIFTSGVGTPNYCQAAANNAISSGAGGAGGAGGYSLINQGGAGAIGTLAGCQFN